MAIPTIEAVVERLDGLERENRILRRIAAALVLVSVLIAVEGGRDRRSSTRVVDAERVVIRDKEGRLRAELGVDASGLPGLRLRDARGREQVALQVSSDDFATLSLNDRGEPRVSLDSSADGSAALRFYDRAQKSSSALFMWPDSTAGLTFNLGRESLMMGVQPDGRSAILTTDAGGLETGRVGNPTVDARSLGIVRGPLIATSPPPALPIPVGVVPTKSAMDFSSIPKPRTSFHGMTN